MMGRCIMMAVLGVVLLGGCFPIELDVSSDGRILIPREEGFFALDPSAGKVTRLHVPGGGKPVFARYSPDGKQILAVTEGGAGVQMPFVGAMGGQGGHIFTLVSLADGASRVIFTGSNGSYARWSPDGQYVSLTRVADEAKAPLEESLPELHLVTVKDGTKKLLASNVSAIHRWFPDSKSLLTLQIQSKDSEEGGRGGDVYRGTLSAIDVATGKGKPLAGIAGPKGVFFDLSPDGKTVLFTARAAGAPGTELKPEENTQLFELTIASGAVRKVGESIKYAIWSPDGKRVLLGTKAKEEDLVLKVADAGLSNFKEVAPKAVGQISEGFMGSPTDVYPGWIGNDEVFYLAKTAVYGTAGANLNDRPRSCNGWCRRLSR